MTTEENSQEQGVSNRYAEFLNIIRGSAFIFACRLGGAVITFLTQVLLARWMGASELGVYVLAFSWCLLLATVAAGGLQVGAIRFVGVAIAQRAPGEARGFTVRAGQVTLIVGASICAIGLLLVNGVNGLVDAPLRAPLSIALLAIPCMALVTVAGGIANGFSNLKLSFLPSNLFRPLLFLGLVVSVYMVSGAVDARQVMILQGFAILATCTLMAVGIGRLIVREAPRAEAVYRTREWLRTSVPLVAAALFTGYFPEFTLIVAGGLLPADQVAMLHVCFRVALLIAFGLFAVDAYAGPRIAQLAARGDLEGLQRVTDSATRLRFWPSLVAVAVLVVVGRPVLGFFGPDFVAGYAVLIVLAVAQLVQAGVGPVARLLGVSGHQDRLLGVFVFALLLLAALMFLLVPQLGLLGAAISVLLDTLIWSFWMRQLVVRYMGIRPRPV